MLLKHTLGHVLPGNSKLKALALKVSAYPDFLRFQEKFAVPELISGAPREKRNKLFQTVSDLEGLSTIPLRYFEFGVHQGKSLQWWSEANQNPDSRFFGFDSFEGLPEDWSAKKQAGYFSTGLALPETDDTRVDFVPGWFHRTLPLMLQKLETEDRVVIHMDADLYRSTIYPLCLIGSHLKDGDVLIFDEFMDSSHEFRAFDDACAIFNWDFDVLAATQQYAQVAIRLKIAEAPVWRRS